MTIAVDLGRKATKQNKTKKQKKHQNLENSTCDPLKCTMGSPILIVSLCMRKSARIQGVNEWL